MENQPVTHIEIIVTMIIVVDHLNEIKFEDLPALQNHNKDHR